MSLLRSAVSLVMIYSAFFVVLGVVWRGLSSFVGCPREPSVIEEKGEGFENGKKYFGSFGVPSTSASLQTTSQDLRLNILINLAHHR
jgi:hypothetical protein